MHSKNIAFIWSRSLLRALLFSLSFYLPAAAYAQIQKGGDIDGEAAIDNSGISVSMADANTVAIGAHVNDGNGTDAGHVRVYIWNGSAWVQKGADIDGEAASDRSGISVSMADVNTVAIGADYNDGNGNNAGHVRIYIWSGSAWVQKGADIDGEAAGDYSGGSVSMADANTVAIGTPLNNGNGSDAGHVRVYIWNGSAWVQKGSDIDGEALGDESGTSVSMADANTVAIGAPRNDGGGSSSGHVRVYIWNGSAWVQKGGDIDGEAAADFSGRSVSMADTNTVAIGAIGNDGNGSDAGHVRIYEWNGVAWVQKGSDINGEAAFDNSGNSISMADVNNVTIGARYNGGSGSNAGHVRIYEWNGSAWVQKGIDLDGEAANDNSGFSVSMPDAYTVAIGAFNNDGNGTDAGHVRIYSHCTPTASSQNTTTCDSYTWPLNGQTYTGSGIYTDTLINAAGCDSIITLYLTINTVDTSVTASDPTLTANATGAAYQWVNCNDYAHVAGATGQSFTATTNGSYAVIITQNGCIDTSACHAIVSIGISKYISGSLISVYPNPANDWITVDLVGELTDISVIVITALGEEVYRERITSASLLNIPMKGAAGVYLLILASEDINCATMKVVKN